MLPGKKTFLCLRFWQFAYCLLLPKHAQRAIARSLHSLVTRLGGKQIYPPPHRIFYFIEALGYIGMVAAALAAIALFVPSLKRHKFLLALDSIAMMLFFCSFVSLTYKLGLNMSSCSDINYTSTNKIMNGGTVFFRKKDGGVIRYGWEDEKIYQYHCTWVYTMDSCLFWSFVFFGITWALGVYYKDLETVQSRKDEEGGTNAQKTAVETKEMQGVKPDECVLRLGNKTGAT